MRVLSLSALILLAAVMTMTIVVWRVQAEPAQINATPQSTPAPHPGLYIGRDWKTLDPTIYPAVGGQETYTWKALEPQEGVYDWGLIDRWLYWQVLQAGKWAAIGVTPYSGRIEGGLEIPQWVYDPAKGGDPHTVINCGGGVIIPRYWDATYLAKYDNFVRALGQRYNGDARLAWVQIGTALYSETQPGDDQDDECVKSAITADFGITQTAQMSSKWVTTVNASPTCTCRASRARPCSCSMPPASSMSASASR